MAASLKPGLPTIPPLRVQGPPGGPVVDQLDQLNLLRRFAWRHGVVDQLDEKALEVLADQPFNSFSETELLFRLNRLVGRQRLEALGCVSVSDLLTATKQDPLMRDVLFAQISYQRDKEPGKIPAGLAFVPVRVPPPIFS